MPKMPTASQQAEFFPYQQAVIAEHTNVHFAARAPPLVSANVALTGAVVVEHSIGVIMHALETHVASLGFDVGLDATNTGLRGPDVASAPPDQSLHPPGTMSAGRGWTKTARLKDAQLPDSGRIRYVPPTNWDGTTPIPRGPNRGYLDRFGNEWTRGPSRTEGQAFEWDVQLSRTGREQIGWTTRDGSHANVSLDGRITHR